VERHVLPTALECLSRAEASRDFGTNSHAWRVARLVGRVAITVGLSGKDARQFSEATVLHDIGKMAVPIDLLQKSTPLLAEELALIRTHARVGHGILEVAGDPSMTLAAEIALSHHERYDGSGYPDGIAGENISLPVQIATICDTYDALRQDRPYRRGMSHGDAMRTIMRGDGRTMPEHFAPRVLSAFHLVAKEGMKDLYTEKQEVRL
jgi:putative two-component system response regulator